MTRNNSSSNSSTMRLPMRRTPRTGLPVSASSGGVTDRSTNGLLSVTAVIEWPATRAARASTYNVTSGSSGTPELYGGAPRANSNSKEYRGRETVDEAPDSSAWRASLGRDSGRARAAGAAAEPADLARQDP